MLSGSRDTVERPNDGALGKRSDLLVASGTSKRQASPLSKARPSGEASIATAKDDEEVCGRDFTNVPARRSVIVLSERITMPVGTLVPRSKQKQ